MNRYMNVTAGDGALAALKTGKNPSPNEEVVIAHSDLDESSSLETISIRPGLKAIVANHVQPRGLRVSYEIERAPVSFCYNLSQHVRCTMADGAKSSRVVERSPGTGVLAYLPRTSGIIESPPGESVVGVSLHFSMHTFRDLFNEVPECLKDLGSNRSRAAGEQRFYQQAPHDRETCVVLRQILECPYGGEVRRLFFEAKSLELVALKLAEMGRERRGDASDLSRRDLDLIRQAHHILLSNLDHPPNLVDLSRLVGINRNKLNMGFKRLYGETAFNVLRNARLSKAWSLLQQTELSLAEIALSVGYNNQANFTTAFRRCFGQTPKRVRQESVGHPFRKGACPADQSLQ